MKFGTSNNHIGFILILGAFVEEASSQRAMFDSKCRWSYFRKSTYHLAYVIIAKVLAQLKRPVIQHMVLKKIPLLKPILFIVLSSKAECFKECQRVCSCTQRGQKIQLLINKMTDEETQKY